MRVTYVSPNRNHQFYYAQALAETGCLHAFVCGHPRFARNGKMNDLGGRVKRYDAVQTLYGAAMRYFGLSIDGAAQPLAWLSKVYLDVCSGRYARESDVFVYYPGAGLRTARTARSLGVITVHELVNSHIDDVCVLLREEARICRVDAPRMFQPEVDRRRAECEEADFVLCPSEFVRLSLLKRGYSPERILKNVYGFAPSQLEHRREMEVCRDTFNIVYVGAISLRKGVRYLIEAFRKFNHPAKRLTIVGGRESITGLEGCPIPDNVEFLGTLQGEELRKVYARSSVFVLPSIEDGFGLVLAEALSFGLPIIATENTGGPDLIEQGREGFVVPIRSPEAIAAALQFLADSPDTHAQMRSAALARAEQLGGWEQSGLALVESLRSAVKQRS